MKRKLKTWEAFKEEFKPLCDEWNVYHDSITIFYKKVKWYISSLKKDKFGTEIEVKKLKGKCNYTHEIIPEFWVCHELWFEPEFEPIEFITKEEMKI